MYLHWHCYKPNFIMMFFFQKSRNPTVRKLYDKYIKYKQNSLKNYEEGLDRACSSKYAFMGTYLLQRRNMRECDLIYLPDESFPSSMSFVLTKHSPYKGIINSR